MSLRVELLKTSLVIDTSSTEWGYEPHVWLSRLSGAIAWFTTKFQDRRFVWRGVANADWDLQPRLHRHVRATTRTPTFAGVLSTERAILDQVEQFGWFEENRVPAGNTLERLAFLQHNGVPTRLLDITRDPLVALYFASDRFITDAGDADGALIALLDTGAKASFDEDRIVINPPVGDVGPSSYAIWQPAPRIGRVISQRSEFVAIAESVNGHSPDPAGTVGIPQLYLPGNMLGDLNGTFDGWVRNPRRGRPLKYPPNVCMFLVPGRRKPQLRNLLEKYGITSRSVYPDLAGYAASFPPS